jgi:hypothetical protein
MKIHGVWASAAVLAAAMMATSPALAQDPAPHKPAPTKKAPAKTTKAPVKKAEPKQKTADVAIEEQTEAADEPAAEATAEAAEAASEQAEAEAEASEAAAEEAAAETEAAEEAAEAETEAEEPAAPARRAPPHRTRPALPSADATAAPTYMGPYEMEYLEGAEIPPGYMKVERMRKGLVIAGAVTFGVSWLVSATAGVALTDEHNNNSCAYSEDYSGNGYGYCDDDDESDAVPLFIPVVGPFIAMGTLDAEGPGRAALFLDGVVQVGGLAMLIAGVAATRTVLVRTPAATVAIAPGPSSVHLTGSF